MNTSRRYLLVRADFVIGQHSHPDSAVCRRWRRVFMQALPRLMGCADRAPAAERVSLHEGEVAGSFTGWVRIPMMRRPDRKKLGKFKRKLRERLEASLTPMDGCVLKLGVRRCTERGAEKSLFSFAGAGQISGDEQSRELPFQPIEKAVSSGPEMGETHLPITYPQPV
jgi:hypothetical protein